MNGKITDYVNKWRSRCYPDLPDESPPDIFDMVPSYQRIAIAILKNDHHLKTLGLNPPHSQYYDILKGIELEQRKYNEQSPKL